MENLSIITLNLNNRIETTNNLTVSQNSTGNVLRVNYLNEYNGMTVIFRLPNGEVIGPLTFTLLYDNVNNVRYASLDLPLEITSFIINGSKAIIYGTLNLFGLNDVNESIKLSVPSFEMVVNYTDNNVISNLTTTEADAIYISLGELGNKVQQNSTEIDLILENIGEVAQYNERIKELEEEIPLLNQSIINNSDDINNINVSIEDINSKDMSQDSKIEKNIEDIENINRDLLDLENDYNSLDISLENTNLNLNKKLDKDISTLPTYSQIGDEDLFLIRSNSINYKIKGSILKQLIDSGSSKHFLGIFSSIESLRTEYPTALPGDYAYVDQSGKQILMYIWDNTDSNWELNTSGGVYVSKDEFDAYKEDINDGSIKPYVSRFLENNITSGNISAKDISTYIINEKTNSIKRGSEFFDLIIKVNNIEDELDNAKQDINQNSYDIAVLNTTKQPVGDYPVLINGKIPDNYLPDGVGREYALGLELENSDRIDSDIIINAITAEWVE